MIDDRREDHECQKPEYTTVINHNFQLGTVYFKEAYENGTLISETIYIEREKEKPKYDFPVKNGKE